MNIQLCEDDGLFHDGVPQIVILVVKFDDGKTKRIPYPADKTISALYQDLQAIEPKVEVHSRPATDQEVFETFNNPPKSLEETHARGAAAVKENNKPKVDKSKIIDKEDIVTMVKMHERDKNATCLLVVGMDYRVIEVIGPRHPVTQEKIAQGYDVIDDTAATPERMRVFVDEVVLKRKRVLQGIDKTMAVEEILPCPHCKALNSLTLKGDTFIGACESCTVDISIARVIKKCQTAKCGKDVSCFDVGGKYEGKCGGCGSMIEVPYA